MLLPPDAVAQCATIRIRCGASYASISAASTIRWCTTAKACLVSISCLWTFARQFFERIAGQKDRPGAACSQAAMAFPRRRNSGPPAECRWHRLALRIEPQARGLHCNICEGPSAIVMCGCRCQCPMVTELAGDAPELSFVESSDAAAVVPDQARTDARIPSCRSEVAAERPTHPPRSRWLSLIRQAGWHRRTRRPDSSRQKYAERA